MRETVINDGLSTWSVRDIGGVDDDNQDVKDDAYQLFVSSVSKKIINRISMRLLITQA